jgi:glycosyltransferase involved in cell wall biosynthesis
MSNIAGPIVSVVIPAFNRERLVGEAIDSVLAQDSPLELIVVDDGSTDGTAAVVQAYGDALRYHYQENRGISGARNAGVALANGAFLAFLDSDDVWTANKLPRQLAALEADPSLEAVFGHAEQFYDTSVDDAFRSRHPIKVQNVPATLSTAMLIRRESFDRVGPFDATVDFGVDVDWYLRAREVGLRTEILPDVVYRRRLHADNVGRTNGAEANLARLRALRRSLDRRRAAVATESTTTAPPPRTQGSQS